MRKSVFTIALLLLAVGFFIQCRKENVESRQQNTNCDTLNVPYSKISSILTANSCTGCHGATASVPLDNYNNVKTVALSGRLIGATEHLPGYIPMPNSSQKISDCDRKTIRAWINQGARN